MSNYDHEITLIGIDEVTSDAIGNQKIQPKETTILCRLKSVGGQEFYNAAVAGLKPVRTFVVHHYEYSGEKTVKFEDVKYSVIRTYATDIEEIELVCERVTGNV